MTLSLYSMQSVDIRQYLCRIDDVSLSVPIDVPFIIIVVAALRRKRTVESPRVVSQEQGGREPQIDATMRQDVASPSSWLRSAAAGALIGALLVVVALIVV